jgi:hypothetical protein
MGIDEKLRPKEGGYSEDQIAGIKSRGDTDHGDGPAANSLRKDANQAK